MDRSESLEKVTFDLDIPMTWFEDMRRRKDSGSSFPVSLNNARLVPQLLSKMTQGSKVVVEFEVPRAIRIGLESGEYIRKGGVIVTSKGHHVKHWLKEGKALRHVGMAVNALCIFVDILSQILLNEKLKQIQVQLDRIEDKLDAQLYHTYVAAHEALKAALNATEPSYRVELFKQSRYYFMEARSKSLLELRKKTERIHKELLTFDSNWIANKKELVSIYRMLEDVGDLTETISHCYKAEARICETLGEILSAEDLHNEALNFQAASCEFIDWFLNGEKSYSELEFVQGGIVGKANQGQKLGRIHERAGTWGDAAGDAALIVATSTVSVPLAAYFTVKKLIAPKKSEQKEQNRQKEIPLWVEEIRDPLSQKLKAMESLVAQNVFNVMNTKIVPVNALDGAKPACKICGKRPANNSVGGHPLCDECAKASWGRTE
jgi:hypothetical protein